MWDATCVDTLAPSHRVLAERDFWGLFKEVARRIVATTNEPQTLQFLQQRVAVAVQRGNAASIQVRLWLAMVP